MTKHAGLLTYEHGYLLTYYIPLATCARYLVAPVVLLKNVCLFQAAVSDDS